MREGCSWIPFQGKVSVNFQRATLEQSNNPISQTVTQGAILPPCATVSMRKYPENRQSAFASCVRCRSFKKKCNATASNPCSRCETLASKTGQEATIICQRGALFAAESKQFFQAEVFRLKAVMHDLSQGIARGPVQPAASLGLSLSQNRPPAATLQLNQLTKSRVPANRQNRVSQLVGGKTQPGTEAACDPKAGVEQLEARGWEFLGTIGKGSGGTVYRAHLPTTKEITGCKKPVAVKFCVGQHVTANLMQKEHSMMQMCSGLPHVIQLSCGDDPSSPVGVVKFGQTCALVTEFVQSVSLNAIRGNHLLMKQWRATGMWTAIRCASSALSGMHKRGLVHGDVKPTNIAISTDLKGAVMCDLGHARSSRTGITHYGTCGFKPPEMPGSVALPALGPHAQLADAWALGATAMCFALVTECICMPTGDNHDPCHENFKEMQESLHRGAKDHSQGDAERNLPHFRQWPYQVCKNSQPNKLPANADDSLQNLWLWLAKHALAVQVEDRSKAVEEGMILGSLLDC